MDNALRKALEKFYPTLKKVRLTNYKVRVLDTKAGTGAKVRVLLEASDGKDWWGTVGVSENIIQAKERIKNGIYFADTCIQMIKLNKDLT